MVVTIFSSQLDGYWKNPFIKCRRVFIFSKILVVLSLQRHMIEIESNPNLPNTMSFENPLDAFQKQHRENREPQKAEVTNDAFPDRKSVV